MRSSRPAGRPNLTFGRPGGDVAAVLRQFELPREFPRAAIQEAHALGSEVLARESVGRVDCRAHPVITIDPADAKDFDDAICLQPAGDDRWRLWVHIADVSHYVRPGSALDLEARRRGNSTYLVDRVIPMLPEILSNELCSLKPQVDRLTKCVEFLIHADGRVLEFRCHTAVIHSQRRFTYEEAFAALQRAPQDPITQMLHHAHQLAQRIRRRRFAAGALDLDFPETRIRLDAQGRVAAIDKVQHDTAHQLIEEFMLLANEAVAARLRQQRRPAVYRVHEPPEKKRLEEYRALLAEHRVACGDLQHRQEIQRLLGRLNTVPVGPALKIGFLRSLNRARYAIEPLGHFGLAKKNYAHFTSPIRRYADLLVHRAVFAPAATVDRGLGRTAEHISETERNSADAERASKEIKLLDYLRDQLTSGRRLTYQALVTDVRPLGLFVDVTDLGLRGLVPATRLARSKHKLSPRAPRARIQLGDTITVQVAKVDLFRKLADFEPVQPLEALDAFNRGCRNPSPTFVPPRERRPQPGRDRARAAIGVGARR